MYLQKHPYIYQIWYIVKYKIQKLFMKGVDK